MQEESLNIDYHISRLVVRVLNKVETKVEAHRLLGCSEKTLYRYIWCYNLKQKNGVWINGDIFVNTKNNN